jgi:hypothetical protein
MGKNRVMKVISEQSTKPCFMITIVLEHTRNAKGKGGSRKVYCNKRRINVDTRIVVKEVMI